MSAKFVSEAIVPLKGTFSTRELARGEPSLPEGFTWRKKVRRITEVLSGRKVLRTESFSGDRYLRRHEYRLRMDDGAIWVVYFARQPLVRGRRRSPRWFLKTIEKGPAERK